jgi:hypothetical protein
VCDRAEGAVRVGAVGAACDRAESAGTVRAEGVVTGGRRSALQQEEGFLLLEALIGLAILGAVVIGLLSAAGTQVRAADQASVLLVASALAQDRAAAIQILDYQGLVSPPDSLLAGTFEAPFDDFEWTAQVEHTDNEYDLFAVRVEVSGRGHLFPLETLVHRMEPGSGPVAGGAAGAGGGGGGSGAPGGAAGAAGARGGGGGGQGGGTAALWFPFFPPSGAGGAAGGQGGGGTE